MNIAERSAREDHLEKKPNSNMEYYKFSTVPDAQPFTKERAYNITLVDTVGLHECRGYYTTVGGLQRQFDRQGV
jgi:hypothetical protein